MAEDFKNRIILILSVLTVLFFLTTVGSCANARRQKISRDKEMSIRLDVEERMSKFTQEKTELEEKIDSLSKQMNKEKTELDKIKKDLAQEQSLNQKLQEELEKTTKLKETLEEDLKEELIKTKSKTRR